MFGLTSDSEYYCYQAQVEEGCRPKNGLPCSKCRRPSFHLGRLTFIFLPMLAMAITALTVGIIYPAESCDRNEILSLSWWLRTYGGVSLYFAIAYPTILLIVPTNRCELLSMEILLIGFAFATIAWNVFGCTILFRGSLDCYSQSSVLWYTTLITLIVQWYNFFVSCMVKLERERLDDV